MAVAGFEIDGETYEVPALDTLTLDEERILYLYADTVIRDFIPPLPNASEDEKREYEVYQARKIRNPDFKRALAYVTYRRSHPDVDEGDVLKAIGKINAFSLDLALLQGDDDSPPAQSSQNGHSQPSETNEPTSSTPSGTPTERSLAQADETPEPTGTTE